MASPRPRRRSSARYDDKSLRPRHAAPVRWRQPTVKLPGGAVSPHDLRRTMRTHLGKLRIPPHITERCLNHSLGRIVQTYDLHDYIEERREALERWDGLRRPARHRQGRRGRGDPRPGGEVVKAKRGRPPKTAWASRAAASDEVRKWPGGAEALASPGVDARVVAEAAHLLTALRSARAALLRGRDGVSDAANGLWLRRNEWLQHRSGRARTANSPESAGRVWAEASDLADELGRVAERAESIYLDAGDILECAEKEARGVVRWDGVRGECLKHLRLEAPAFRPTSTALAYWEIARGYMDPCENVDEFKERLEAWKALKKRGG